MKFNIANPATGQQKLIDVEDERKVCVTSVTACVRGDRMRGIDGVDVGEGKEGTRGCEGCDVRGYGGTLAWIRGSALQLCETGM